MIWNLAVGELGTNLHDRFDGTTVKRIELGDIISGTAQIVMMFSWLFNRPFNRNRFYNSDTSCFIPTLMKGTA